MSTITVKEEPVIMRLRRALDGDAALKARLDAIQAFNRTMRGSEYHITTACNIRCKGCWFFAKEFDEVNRDERSIEKWNAFAAAEARDRRITAAVLIGGEPSLFPDRIRAFQQVMPYVTVSTNGLELIPRDGMENVAIMVTLFGGGPLDDELRGIKPSGTRIEGLFGRALGHYRDDPRAVFVLAVTEGGERFIEDTVRAVGENGNRLIFSYYRSYDLVDPVRRDGLSRAQERLLEESLRVKALYPEIVISDPLLIRTLITGETWWGKFGYDVCPHVTENHPDNQVRLKNGHPALPRFRAYASDLETLHMCCTSGSCSDCRDTATVQGWLNISFKHFLDSREHLVSWVEMLEAYWSAFIWNPFHPSKRAQPPKGATLGPRREA